jgi:hypothetical protein
MLTFKSLFVLLLVFMFASALANPESHFVGFVTESAQLSNGKVGSTIVYPTNSKGTCGDDYHATLIGSAGASSPESTIPSPYGAQQGAKNETSHLIVANIHENSSGHPRAESSYIETNRS